MPFRADLIRYLLGRGLTRSAWTVARSCPGPGGWDVNELKARARRAAERPGIRAGIHLLSVHRGAGVVVPCDAVLARLPSLTDDTKAQEAQVRARQAVLAVLGVGRTSPPLCWLAPTDLAPRTGASLGLPAALAFAAALSNRDVRMPVLATGDIDVHGNILRVDELEAKLEAARSELEGTHGLVLAHPDDLAARPPGLSAHGVRTLREALEIAFEGEEPEIDPNLLDLDELVEAHAASTDHCEAIRCLEAFRTDGLSGADQARLLLALGNQYRHVGHIDRAAACHDQARALMHDVLYWRGRVEVETYECDCILATDMDQCEAAAIESRLRERLEGDFELPRNRVRCRGMLAQACHEQGRYAEAARLRRLNLSEQQGDASLRAEIPRTLVWLCLSLAAAGDEAAFLEAARELVASTMDGADHQHRYNAMGLVRGLVLLGRADDALALARGAEPLPGLPAPPGLAGLFAGRDPVATDPEISTLRALARALRRVGDLDGAIRIADRMASDGPSPVLAWLATLPRIEGALALVGLGRPADARAGLFDCAVRMEACGVAVHRTHGRIGPLLRAPDVLDRIPELERLVDGVFH